MSAKILQLSRFMKLGKESKSQFLKKSNCIIVPRARRLLLREI